MEEEDEYEDIEEGEDDNDNDEDEDQDEDELRVTLVGMNLCGCDPGAPCSLVAYGSAEEALAHGMTHVQRLTGQRLLQCGWWGCEYRERSRQRVENHYCDVHLLGKWRCNHCQELFGTKRLAEGCKHFNQVRELWSECKTCEWEGCARAEGTQMPMEAGELKEHVGRHLDEATAAGAGGWVHCKWRGCGKALTTRNVLQRHLDTCHLRLKWKCLQCSTYHKKETDALNCCTQQERPEPWTPGFSCRWLMPGGPHGTLLMPCGQEFVQGSGDAARTHLRAHTDNASQPQQQLQQKKQKQQQQQQQQQQVQCGWEDCGQMLKTRQALRAHVEVVHGALRLKCPSCSALHPIKRHSLAVHCSHAPSMPRAPPPPQQQQQQEIFFF